MTFLDISGQWSVKITYKFKKLLCYQLFQHNFDFNKLFKEGIPYLREDEAQKLKTEMQERHAKYDEIRENSLNSSLNTTPKAR